MIWAPTLSFRSPASWRSASDCSAAPPSSPCGSPFFTANYECTGGITFQVRATAEYLGLGLPKKIANWKNQYFYMREDTPFGQVAVPPFSLCRSHPRNLNALPGDAKAGVVEVMLERLHEMITKEHLCGINLVSVWVQRRVAPLK
jgi:hypothetical protein